MSSIRPTARIRHNRVLSTAAKLCRQYLKWFGNGSYKPARNGERWLLETLRGESIRTVLDVGANVGFEYGRVNILTRFLLRDFYQLFASYGYVVGKIYSDYVDFRDYDLGDEDFLGPNYLACRAGDAALGRISASACHSPA